MLFGSMLFVDIEGRGIQNADTIFFKDRDGLVVVGEAKDHHGVAHRCARVGVHEFDADAGLHQRLHDLGQAAGSVGDFRGHDLVDEGGNAHFHQDLAGLGHIGEQQAKLAEGAGVHQVEGAQVDPGIAHGLDDVVKPGG
ncbi:hypothetical protein DESC_720190 [Desulfosarcina cetonica]|nr:hypothetical protein DESC_720190 [Desulfosarcina cetonica]